MELAYFSGCKLPFYIQDYDLSFRGVMRRLGVKLVDLSFNCCGNPARNDNFQVSMFSAIKNLALAQQAGLDIITPCKCCFGQFKHAIYRYHTHRSLRGKIDFHLAQEGLFWDGKTRVDHLISFLAHDYGLDQLKKKVQTRLPGNKVALQYGCHALRPFSITGFDNPFAPKIFETILKLSGVIPVEWSKSTECCGNPIFEYQKDLSLSILQNKYDTARSAGADLICTACTHCQLHYEMAYRQDNIDNKNLRTLLFTQILGAALGVDEQELSDSGKLSAILF